MLDHLQLHLTTKEQTPRPAEIKLIGRIHRCNYNFAYLYIYIRINNLRLPLHLQAGEKRTTTSRWIRTPHIQQAPTQLRRAEGWEMER